jgi:asparagine synthase (glutamine-hydrolysing)
MSRDKVELCCDILQHRGPDGKGIWQENDVALAHRRLSIIDLSENGKQPMSYAEGRLWITYNGEIYNYLEIKKNSWKMGMSLKVIVIRRLYLPRI